MIKRKGKRNHEASRLKRETQVYKGGLRKHRWEFERRERRKKSAGTYYSTEGGLAEDVHSEWEKSPTYQRDSAGILTER